MFTVTMLKILGMVIGCISAVYVPEYSTTALLISQASYCMSNTNTWVCKSCNADNILENKIEHKGELVILGYNSQYRSAFIGFRGSSNIQNWISNIQIIFTHPYNDTSIAVSDGFFKLYDSLKEDIFTNLLAVSNKYDTSDVIITGHSLGGALATLCAFDILYHNIEYNIKFHITFGSPRVGNRNFFEQFTTYDIYSKRITHYYDIVPHVPEEVLGYRHINNEVWYNEENSGYVICNDDYVEDNSCSDSCAPNKCTSISDHLNYLNISMGSDGYC